MAIEYLEIRGNNREVLGIVDEFQSIIWHAVWYGVGDFEIYAKANETNLELLQENNYVTRTDGSDEIGIIERVEIANSLENGSMITATGRFAKSILDRRLIYNLSNTQNKATVLSGNVEAAVRSLVNANSINCTFDTARNIAFLELGTLKNIPLIIVDENGTAAEKQVSYQNLLEYSDELLQEYELSSKIILDDETKKLQYEVMQGVDRSVDNTNGNDPIVFSRDYDNLSESNYEFDTTNAKNFALIGGEGEGLERFYATIVPTSAGLARREVFVDAASLSKKYKDDNDVEQTYTDAQYRKMLKQQGKQELAQLTTVESFTGSILVSAGNYILNDDFKIGDVVTVQENSINKFVNVRITEATEVQDENGYTVDAVYE